MANFGICTKTRMRPPANRGNRGTALFPDKENFHMDMNDQTAVAAADAPASAPSDAPDHAARNRLVIGLLLASAFVVILNETIMSVAIPRLMDSLGVTASAAQWLTTAFLLTMSVVIPITGFILQRFHTRTMFLAAMIIFSIGTAICIIAPGLEVLVFGRVVQAMGTAIMMPLLMTTVMNLVPAQSRGQVMGNISIVISVAPALGPTISGFILNTLGWRYLFILVLPIALIALAVGYRWMKNVTEPRYAPIDLISVALTVPGFGGLVYGLSLFGEPEADRFMQPWLPLGIGIVTLVAFVWRQLLLQREDKALLDLRTFKTRIFTVALIMMVISMMALFGTIILLPIYMQNVLGVDPLTIGLLLLPGGLIMGLLAPFVGRWYDAHGARVLLIPGSILVSAVLWSMTLLSQDTVIWAILAGHIVLSLGLALIFTPLFTSSLGSLPPKLYSHGSAVIGSFQQVAGAAGIALFVALMSIGVTSLTAEGLGPVEATAGGIRIAFTCGAIISLFMIACAFFVRRPQPQEGIEGMPAGH